MKYTFRILAFSLLTSASMGVYAQTDVASNPVPQSTKASRAADRALSKQVRVALLKAKILDVPTISVRVKNGAVTLAGFVRDQSQIERAGEVAQTVSGVTSVKNAITIRQPGQ
ncbi:BON domain-containing protein [Paraburkholderia silviterrae]|uniref:BON domain-containing protein n=1 Tax=Paraburkholderia silviterrae TaxID=2528715 RepID=A0A4R5MFE7_9BURK|nr:BON domain-containing protein [Paraburkholderia silviterrae]TDG25973.1 BON domain-containing protein [Paraburkholderia silviterrae]